MIDNILSTASQLRGPESAYGYDPADAIVSTDFSEVPGSEKLTVAFPPWHSPKWLSRLVARKLTKQGSNSLVYRLSPNVLNHDPDKVRQSFEHIVEQVSDEVNVIAETNGYTKTDLLGISLGNVPLSMTAENLNSFDDVTMVVPGAELATAFWTGIRTRSLSDTYRARPDYSLDRLRKEWENLAPISHLGAFAGHSVRVILATADRYIPFEYGQDLVGAMHQAELSPAVITTNGGHVSTIARFALMQQG